MWKPEEPWSVQEGTWELEFQSQIGNRIWFLHESFVALCRLRPERALSSGRGIVRLHSLSKLLSELIPEVGGEVGPIDLNECEGLAVPIQVQEVERRLPVQCGLCNPERFLKGAHLRAFQIQDLLRWTDVPCRNELPRFCYRVASKDEHLLRSALLKRGFSCLVPESKLLTDTDGGVLLNGLFMVQDRPGKYRLIFDKRPTNYLESALKWLELQMGCMFGRVRLQDDEDIRASGTDLDSYFNRLLQHGSAIAGAGFGRRIDPKTAKSLGFETEEHCRQAVTITGMGGGTTPLLRNRLTLKF